MRLAALLSIIISLLVAAWPARAATEIPFAYRDGMVWLKVTVKGKGEPLNFLLDSGAGASVLDLSAARRLGLKLGATQNVLGVDSRSTAYRIDGPVAQTAGATTPPLLLAIDLRGPSRACGERIDGLLGADFFRGRIVRIDFAAHTVSLLQRGEVTETGCEVLPLKARNDALCTCISINGNAPEWLRLDTGCNSALEWVVKKLKARNLGLRTIGVDTGSSRELHTDVKLGSKSCDSVKTGIHSEPMFAGESGLIGNGLLSRFAVTIDADRRRCLLATRREDK